MGKIRGSLLQLMAKLIKALVIFQYDFTAINADDIFLVQTAECAADSLDGKAEEIAHVHA